MIKNGEVIIYISNHFSFRTIDVSKYCEKKNLEITAVALDQHKLISLSVYNQLDGEVELFISSIYKLLTSLSQFKYDIMLCGDFNSHFDITTDQSTVVNFQKILQQ